MLATAFPLAIEILVVQVAVYIVNRVFRTMPLLFFVLRPFIILSRVPSVGCASILRQTDRAFSSIYKMAYFVESLRLQPSRTLKPACFLFCERDDASF